MVYKYFSMISSHSEKHVAHFNITNLNKSEEEFFARQKSSSWPHFASYWSKICTDCSIL